MSSKIVRVGCVFSHPAAGKGAWQLASPARLCKATTPHSWQGRSCSCRTASGRRQVRHASTSVLALTDLLVYWCSGSLLPGCIIIEVTRRDGKSTAISGELHKLRLHHYRKWKKGVGNVSGRSHLIWQQMPLDWEGKTALLRLMV